MKRQHSTQAHLRRRAEGIIKEQPAGAENAINDADARYLVYELQVHQIELELQNEELRQAQAATERALARYTELYEFAPVGYLGLDRVGTVLEIHLAAAALLGVEHERLEGRRLGVFVKEADRPALADMLAEVFGDPGKASCELALETDQPHFVRIDAGITPSQPGRCRAVVWDITELKLSQLTLSQRIKEQRCLNRVLELTGDDTRPADAICADLAALLPDGLQHEDVAVTRIVLDGVEYPSPDWRPPVAALQRSITEDNRSIGFVEIGYRAARPEQAGGGEGPFLVEERTLLDSVATQIQRMLDGRRMADSLRRAQRLESVGQLTGGIAHDFNNLLTVILGNAELLNEELTRAAPRLRPLAEMVVQGAQRGGELTQRLLAFARKQALDPKPVDLNRLLVGMNRLLRRTLGEHIEIEFNRATEPWLALVDPAQLESALLNLCLNARDAMPRGGRLTIETGNISLDEDDTGRHAEVQPGDYVLLAISDTGTGIPPDHLDRVFEPFFTTKGKGKGTGLGLSMVYGFVKQSRGHVVLRSEPGEGTTVKLYLPRLSES